MCSTDIQADFVQVLTYFFDNGIEPEMLDGDTLHKLGNIIQTFFDDQGGLIGTGKIRLRPWAYFIADLTSA